jgi:NADPH-dependent 2,4-dienoyl-CoA reductase/sulfur reductase-like enzyme
MKKYDVIVIGGSAAGLVASITGKSAYPEKSFLTIRKDKKAVVPCGIPYIFHELDSVEKDYMPDDMFQKLGIELLIDEVVKIDKENKKVITKSGQEFGYEKLVIATGSRPNIPKIPGVELENVFTVPKSGEYLGEMRNKISNVQDVVIIGAGFIGVEVAEQLVKDGKNVYLIEIMQHILPKAFDEDVARFAAEELEKMGVKILTNSKVSEIFGNGKVEGVKLESGGSIKAQVVILAAGYVPNTELAVESGIELNKYKMIRVDSYMRVVDDQDIFAVGDCAQKVDFITRRSVPIMLASTAVTEARIAAMNLFELSTVREFLGTIAVFSTKIGNKAFGSAGLIEEEAKKNGFEIVTGYFEAVDKHPGTLPNANKQAVKLIVSKECGTILGGEVFGGDTAGEIINVIGMAIQKHMTVAELYTLQIGTHPLLTSAPTVYPLIKAAEQILFKR